ncbi:competence protein CoiA family protein [Paraburkholderia phymatum]|uniref:competence protein CoiA family protein n=1 Tax=Paraburkholderia phymatum TaxID=148447 RepID=UPI0006943E32|nr:competence protein CoiA family protein [Paraburkholderia phymatum]
MKIPFALDEKDRIVDIHDVPHVEGNFRCAECRQLVTRKQGDVRVWHFAHKAETACTGAFETALHLLAKQILVESDTLHVPALVCRLYERPGPADIALCVEQTLYWDAAGEAEVWVDGIRPDFRGVCQSKAIFVEVTVTHEPDAPKLEALKRLQTPTLEIDLSAVPRDVKEPEVRQLVLDATEGKRWLFYPGEAEARAQLNALRDQRDAAFGAALEQERQEERRRDAALAAARADARAERLKKIEMANARFRDATTAQKLAFLEAKLRKPVSSWPASLGHEVWGGSAFRVPTRIWQADAFRKYIHEQGARPPYPRVSVETVAEWLVQRYAIASTESTSVRVAVWDFLSVLERAGYLRRRVRQEFEILRDELGTETEVPGPEAKATALKTATRGLFWAHDVADESQFWSAVRKTGVHVAPSDARMLLSVWRDARLRRANAAAYARNVAATLRITVEKAVELLTAAGVFVRDVA